MVQVHTRWRSINQINQFDWLISTLCALSPSTRWRWEFINSYLCQWNTACTLIALFHWMEVEYFASCIYLICCLILFSELVIWSFSSRSFHVIRVCMVNIYMNWHKLKPDTNTWELGKWYLVIWTLIQSNELHLLVSFFTHCPVHHANNLKSLLLGFSSDFGQIWYEYSRVINAFIEMNSLDNIGAEF